MPSNLGKKGAPFLALGNCIRNLGLQKGKKGPLGGLAQRLVLSSGFRDEVSTGLREVAEGFRSSKML